MAAAAAAAVFQTEFGRTVADCVRDGPWGDGTLTPPKFSGCQAKLDAVCGLLLVNGPCGGWDGVRLKSVCCDGQRGIQLRCHHSPSPPLLGALFEFRSRGR